MDVSIARSRPNELNCVIIAHVDHRKTPLVDRMLRQARPHSQNHAVAERVMGSNELERERGITILAKDLVTRAAIRSDSKD